MTYGSVKKERASLHNSSTCRKGAELQNHQTAFEISRLFITTVDLRPLLAASEHLGVAGEALHL